MQPLITGNNMSKPYLSIVIPAYNEAGWIGQCLSDIAAQQGAPPYEVIVVDNNSTDRTAAIVASDHTVRLIHESRRGVCVARQAGFLAALGDIVVSTDADCRYPVDWLAGIAASFRSQPDVVLRLGNYRFTTKTDWLNRLLAAWEGIALRIKYGLDKHLYVSAANLAYRRRNFPGYDSRLSQGGDELYVLSQLRSQGRITYDFTNPIRTSDRRLQHGFMKVLIGDFMKSYVIQYLWNRSSTRPARHYSAHRQLTPPRRRLGSLLWLTVLLCVSSLLVYSAWLLISHNSHIVRISLGLFGLGLGALAYGSFGPHAQLLGPQLYQVPTGRRVIALTFDDGPNGQFTTDIADIIGSYGGRATFFQVGKCVARWPEITRRLHTSGHLIANHSYRHALIDYFKPGAFQRSILQTNDRITAITRYRPQFVRFPWLLRTFGTFRIVHRLGLRPVAGSFASVAEFRQPRAERIFRQAYAKSKPGAILIFHDGYNASGADRTQTVAAVTLLCHRLHNEGYQFVRLDELT